jgi:hypothetical protein
VKSKVLDVWENRIIIEEESSNVFPVKRSRGVWSL